MAPGDLVTPTVDAGRVLHAYPQDAVFGSVLSDGRVFVVIGKQVCLITALAKVSGFDVARVITSGGGMGWKQTCYLKPLS